MRKYWIISADPGFYDAERAFAHLDLIDWGTSANIAIDDIVFIYICRPKQKIGFMTRVLNDWVKPEDMLNNDAQFYGPKYNPNVKRTCHWVRLELICKASKDITLPMLHDKGMRGNIQGPRTIGGDLLELVMSGFSGQDTPDYSTSRTAQKRVPVAAKSSPEEKRLKASIQVGCKVIHKSFGEGVVSSFNDDKTMVMVKLNTGDEKRFMFPDAFMRGFLKDI